jgi:peptide subunit release factor 1 (eRF1)
MSKHNWQQLISGSIKPNRSVLSVYLNVNQSDRSNLNRGFETQFENMTAVVQSGIRDAAELTRFRTAQHRLADFLKVYQVAGQTLAMFFDESAEFFWHQELEIPMKNEVRWDRQFFLSPLAAATDDYERYGVVLVNRASVRLFTVFLGQIEEVGHENFDPSKVRHIKTVGADHLGSASQVQRKADQQVRKNLRQAIRDLDSRIVSKRVHRVILAGTPELTAELKGLLPKRLAAMVIDCVNLNADASPKEVLDATLPLTQRYERDTEEQTVKEVVTSAAKSQRAVVGLSAALEKINNARVWKLIYSEDFHSPGFECTKCGLLFSTERPSCLYCDAALLPVDDVVERAVELALRHEAGIEVIRGEAAAILDSAGGIGALVRTRTHVVQM